MSDPVVPVRPHRSREIRSKRLAGRFAGIGGGLVLAIAGLTGPLPGHAQGPSANRVSETIALKAVVFRGNAAVGTNDLQRITAPYIGKQVSLKDLEALAARVTTAYRDRGFFLAVAVVPEQNFASGNVEISILEGRLGKVDVRVATDAPISEARVRAIVGRLRPGDALEATRYERTMLLLSDLPGIKVQAGLEQGIETGTTDLVVEVAAADRPWDASASVDNLGTRASGRYRVSGNVRYLSPFGIGDNLDARLLTTSNAGQTFGRLSYEAPIGADGVRVGVGGSRVSYELGGQYEALGASGTAVVFDTSLTYPIIRSRPQNLFLRVGVETKKLHDETSTFEVNTRKHVDSVSFGLNWESRDDVLGGGYTSASASPYLGRLRFDDDQSRTNDQSVFGRQTEGHFAKLNLQASRLQKLFGRNNLFVSFSGQISSRNLDASEKLALGGDGAVRAYPSGELLVDRGWIGTVEWRYSVTNNLVLAAFYDAAGGRQAKSPGLLDPANSRHLRGPGVGLNWSAPYDFIVRASAAWRETAAPVSDSGSSKPRFLAQVTKAF